jgi:uncharacterized membrane protein YphA (DoxX/SURF4 family)
MVCPPHLQIAYLALGFLLLRVIVAIALIVRCVQLVNGESLQAITPHVIAAVAGLFVLFGLWTSVAGAVVALIELFIAFSHHHDPWLSVLLAQRRCRPGAAGPRKLVRGRAAFRMETN